MLRKMQRVGLTRISYFVKGSSPRLLIHSGTHGDERGVIASVRKAVKRYLSILPDFIYVPKVSPSAVKSKTRNNMDDVDLNRSFKNTSEVSEVVANIKILSMHNFEIGVTFHEDPECNDFYLYNNSDRDLNGENCWEGFKKELIQLRVNLFSGVDDPNDPSLGYEFVNGYLFEPPEKLNLVGGSFTEWALQEKVAKGVLTIEVPGRLKQSKKDLIVDSFFRHFFLGEDAQRE